MNVETKKDIINYIETKQKYIFNNEFVLCLMSFIELLPIIYHSFVNYMDINQTYIQNLSSKLKYISYLDLAHKDLSINSQVIYLLVTAIILLSYISYLKLFQYTFFYQIKIVSYAMINLFEFGIFRIGCIFVFDCIINALLSDNFVIITIAVIVFVFTVFCYWSQFNSNLLHLPLKDFNCNSFNNPYLVFYEKSLLIIKILISFKINISNKYIREFISFIFFLYYILASLFSFYKLIYSKLFYCFSSLHNILILFFNIFLTVIQIALLFSYSLNKGVFIFLVINAFFISFTLCFMIHNQVLIKLKHKDNSIGRFLYLASSYFNKSNEIRIQRIIDSHKIFCNKKQCSLCALISTISFKEKTSKEIEDILYNVSYLLYKVEIRKNKSLLNNSTSLKLFLLIQLYMSSHSSHSKIKRIFKVINKYAQIMKKYLTFIKQRNGSIDFHYLAIRDCLLTLIKNKNIDIKGKFSFLTKTELSVIETKKFIKVIKKFLKKQLVSPIELISLGKLFTKLHNECQFDFLSSKENKLNYYCIISGFIIEEIFNGKINSSCFFHEFIQKYDEHLDNNYAKNKHFLLLYDIMTSSITFRLCCKELVEVKNKSFDSIIPPFVKKEGMRRFMKHLLSNNNETFSFYFNINDKSPIEKIIIMVMEIPSITDTNKLNVFCSYKIERANYLIFENKIVKFHNEKVLIGISKSISKITHLNQDIIEYSLFKNKYIYFYQFIYYDVLKIDILNKYLLENNLIRDASNKTILNPIKEIPVTLLEIIEQYSIYEAKIDSKRITDQHLQSVNPITHQLEHDSFVFGNLDSVSLQIQNTSATGGSSGNNSSLSSKTNFKMNELKSEQKASFKHFFNYTYFVIGFNIFILIFISIFSFIQIVNMKTIEKISIAIIDYSSLETLFYATSLSIFTLICVPETKNSTNCVNSFKLFSGKYNEIHPSPDGLLIYEYFLYELGFKSSDMIILLDNWDNSKKLLSSKALTENIQKPFEFILLEDVGEELKINTITLTFEESVKRYVNLLTAITMSYQIMDSPIYIISVNLKEDSIDLSNINHSKELNELQRYIYMLLMNYQKYNLQLSTIENILNDFYIDKINEVVTQITFYVVGFILFHCILLVICFMFVFNFKKLHFKFFIQMYKKITDVDFINYYNNKINYLQTLLFFYKENPNKIVSKLIYIKETEKKRKSELLKQDSMKKKEEKKKPVKKEKTKVKDEIHQKLDMKHINKEYNIFLFWLYIIKVLFLFFVYFNVTVILYLITKNSINKIKIINQYTHENFKVSNNISLLGSLLKVLTLTNQTDEMLGDFFSQQGGYIKNGIQNTLIVAKQVQKEDRQRSLFRELNELIDINCDTLFQDIKDTYIERVRTLDPNHDYYSLFSTYCNLKPCISKYKNEKLLIAEIAYEGDKILDQITDNSYQYLANLQKIDDFYYLFTDIICMMRPLRKRISIYITKDLNPKLMNHFKTGIISYLCFNIAYEVLILISLKFGVINHNISLTKEMLIISNAFEIM